MEYLPRLIEKDLEKWLKRKEALIIKGPRQSGKTTLLKHLEETFGGKYITLEIEEFARALEKNPLLFAERFKSYKILYIDEAQYVKNIGKYLKLIYDQFQNELKLVVTGSGSFEIKEVVGKYLVGRAKYFELLPLSFEEFLLWKNKELHKFYRNFSSSFWNFLLNKDHTIPSNPFYKEFLELLEEFILFGGYPAIVKERDREVKKELLRNLFQTYLERDVFFFLNIRHLEKFKNLLKVLCFLNGRLLEVSSLARNLKMDVRTVENYLSLLQFSYVLELISSFHKNLVTEIKKSKKIYFLDTGLRNAILNEFKPLEDRTDRGELIENFVYSELKKRKIPLFFWRTTGKAEVDFVLEIEEKPIPVEVKFSPKIRRAFYSFLKTYRPSRGAVLCWEKDTPEIIQKDKTLLTLCPLFYL